jgi:hypothetical protein
MTIDHTGHAASGCPQFDVANVHFVNRMEPHEKNLHALMGVPLCCVECGREWGALIGGWRITPQGVFCDVCAEAHE